MNLIFRSYFGVSASSGLRAWCFGTAPFGR